MSNKEITVTLKDLKDVSSPLENLPKGARVLISKQTLIKLLQELKEGTASHIIVNNVFSFEKADFEKSGFTPNICILEDKII